MALTKRYYVCRILGDGLSTLTARRAAICDVLTGGLPAFPAVAAVYGVVNGVLLLPWTLCIAAGADHSLATGADIDALPVASLNTLLSSIPVATLNAIKSKLTARGIDTVKVFSGAVTYADVLRALGRLHDHAFDETRFDVVVLA